MTYAQPPTPPPVASSRGLFGSKIPASAAFIVAILLFLLPLAEIKCGNSTIANQTGIGFAMGNEWNAVGMFDQKDLQKKSQSKDEKLGNTQITIIVVLALGVLGLLLSFATSSIAGVLGLLSAGGLIYFMIDLKNSFNDSMQKEAMDKASQGSNDLGLTDFSNSLNNMKPTIAFTPWFWIALIAFLAAAVFGFMRRRRV